jgi:hypothetical protein
MIVIYLLAAVGAVYTGCLAIVLAKSMARRAKQKRTA